MANAHNVFDALKKLRSRISFCADYVAVHEFAFGTKRTWASALHMSALGGKADISRTFNELFLSYIGPLSLCRFEPLRCLVLSLGGGNETARQSRRQSIKSATSQDVEVPQCAKSRTRSQFSRYWQGDKCRAAHPRARRSARARSRDRRGAQDHKNFARRPTGCFERDPGKRDSYLQRHGRRVVEI